MKLIIILVDESDPANPVQTRVDTKIEEGQLLNIEFNRSYGSDRCFIWDHKDLETKFEEDIKKYGSIKLNKVRKFEVI